MSTSLEELQCRTCLKTSSSTVSLFTQNIYKILINCANIAVQSDDGFPNVICASCLPRLLEVQDFKTLVEVSDAKLRDGTAPLPKIMSVDESINQNCSNKSDENKMDECSLPTEENQLDDDSFSCTFSLQLSPVNLSDTEEETVLEEETMLEEETKLEEETLTEKETTTEEATMTEKETVTDKDTVTEKETPTEEETMINIFEQIQDDVNKIFKEKMNDNGLSNNEHNDDLTNIENDNNSTIIENINKGSYEYTFNMSESNLNGLPDENPNEEESSQEKEYMFKCVQCQKGFMNIEVFNKHWKEHNTDNLKNNSSLKLISCSKCPNGFDDSAEFEQHWLTHKNINERNSIINEIQIHENKENTSVNLPPKLSKTAREIRTTESIDLTPTKLPPNIEVSKLTREIRTTESINLTPSKLAPNIEVSKMTREIKTTESIDLTPSKLASNIEVSKMAREIRTTELIDLTPNSSNSKLLKEIRTTESIKLTPSTSSSKLEKKRRTTESTDLTPSTSSSKVETKIRTRSINQNMKNESDDLNKSELITPRTLRVRNKLASEENLETDIKKEDAKNKMQLRLRQKNTKAFNYALFFPDHRISRPRYMCLFCRKQYPSLQSMLKHNKNQHNSINQCPVCGKQVASAYLSVHIARHNDVMEVNNTILYNCYLCWKVYNNLLKYKLHLKLHFDEKGYKCIPCSKFFEIPIELIEHSKTHKGNRCSCGQKASSGLPCTKCNILFHLRCAKRSNQLINEDGLTCSSCIKTPNKKLKNEPPEKVKEEANKSIINNVDIPTKDEFECNICKLYLGSLPNLELHNIHFHDKNEEYICVECSTVSISRYCHVMHLKTHVKQYKCNRCALTFETPRALKVHSSRTHIRKKSFECPFCCKLFVYKTNLNLHYSVCTGGTYTKTKADDLNMAKQEKNPDPLLSEFTCTQCDTNYNSWREFKSHIKSHGTIPYNSLKTKKKVKRNRTNGCPVCLKYFPSYAQFSLHTKQHRVEEFKKCRVCGQVLGNLIKKVQHEYLKHGFKNPVKPYYCSKCGCGFTSRINIREHLANIHDDKKKKCAVCKKMISRLMYNKHMHLVHGREILTKV